MGESIRTLLGTKLTDLVNPYIQEGHIGDVFYVLMSLAARLNIEGGYDFDMVETNKVEEEKCIKKSRRPVKSSELEPITEEGEGCCG
jgi:hypothetical protein